MGATLTKPNCSTKQFMLPVTLQTKASFSITWQPHHFHSSSPGRSTGKPHFNSNSFASVQPAFTLTITLKPVWKTSFTCTYLKHDTTACALFSRTALSFDASILGWLLLLGVTAEVQNWLPTLGIEAWSQEVFNQEQQQHITGSLQIKLDKINCYYVKEMFA